MKETIQIVFIDAEPVYPDTGLVDDLMFRDPQGRIHPSGSVISIYFVHMKLIDKIVKEKGFKALNELEQLYYLFKSGAKGDILKVRKRLVKAFMKKYKHMEQDQEWWTLADAIERGEQRNKALLQEARQEGHLEGHLEGQQKILKSQITSKFQIDASDWIKLLNSDQLDKAAILMLSCASFDDLKQQISLYDKTKQVSISKE